MAPHKNPEIIVIDDDSDADADVDVLPRVDSRSVGHIGNVNNFPDEVDLGDGNLIEDFDGDALPFRNINNAPQVEVPKREGDLLPANPTPTNCKDSVRAVFPDICPVYLDGLINETGNNSDVIIDVILNSLEEGKAYPRQEVKNPLKRKRGHDDEENDDSSDDGIAEDIKAKISDPGYIRKTATVSYKKIAQKLLSTDFGRVHVGVIRKRLAENGGSVFKTYTAMDDAVRNCKADQLPWPEKKVPTSSLLCFQRGHIDHIANIDEYDEFEQLAIAELRAAREVADFKQRKVELEIEEQNNFHRAKSEGQIEECGCCFEECAMNRMIYCDGEKPHGFCRDCMKSQVETNIGLSKHDLTCMSMDGCSAGFSTSQRKLFLTRKTIMALERLEFEASLRMAGIENLETCPFCPYAAEYPPPDMDKEFRCDNPDCQKTSCRLCRKESHIPMSCEESAADHGLSARHILEEAMSEALIRKCNKCQHPYVKIDGCNKVMCTRCHTLQCYVCRKTITSYQHFNDTHRGGRAGQCPLYDQTEKRHEEEIRHAEEVAREQVKKDNPGLDAEALSIKMPNEVKKDERWRAEHFQQHVPGMDPRPQMRAMLGRQFGGPPQPPIPPPNPLAQRLVDVQQFVEQARARFPGLGNPPVAQVNPPLRYYAPDRATRPVERHAQYQHGAGPAGRELRDENRPMLGNNPPQQNIFPWE